ncbi:polyketide synthase dehydratase domain-containing protein, partial [Methylomagnum sp.]
MISAGKVLKTQIHHDDPPVRDLCANGVGFLPGVALLDLMLRLGQAMGQEPAGLALRNIRFRQPIALTDGTDREIRVESEAASDYWTVRVLSRRLADGAGPEDWQEHARAEMHPVAGSDGPDLPDGMAPLENGQDLEDTYAQARELGVVHGDFMKPHGRVMEVDNRRLARLNLGESAREYLDDFLLHPALLDGAVVAASGFGDAPGQFMPMCMDEFRARAALPASLLMCATALARAGEADDYRQNIDLYGLDGGWLASFVGLSG